jgi:acetate---CoA ligase (ADP-forming)
MIADAAFPDTRAEPYSHDALRRLIMPGSVVVVGASETAGSFGATTFNNIRSSYTGRLHAVNPKRQEIFGQRCYADVASIPEAADCAVIIVPASSVEATLAECADRGIGSAIIYSSGFAELGTPEAIEMQRAIARLARARDIRVVGPNCIGLANIPLKFGATFMPSFRELPLKPGPVGIVSQSGALGYMMLQAMRRGVGFSHWLTTGNACDVDVADFINYLVDDQETRAIACSFEGLADPDRFLISARRALQASKPLVVLKVGRSQASREAALSHTGSLVGSSAAYEAALRSVGAVVVDDFEALIETTNFLAKASPPKARGSAVVTMSGGAGILALDLADELDLPMPKPAEITRQRIAEVIPPFGSATNPADLTGESIRFPKMYADTLRAFAEDPDFGSIVIVMASGGYGQLAVDRAKMIEDAAREVQKPVAVVWLNEWLEGPGSEVYDASDVLSSFRSLRRCLATISTWLRYHERRPVLLDRAAGGLPRRTGEPVRSLAPQGTLSERMSKELLANYRVPVTRELLATTADEAVSCADQIGYPVVLKAESKDIPHKSEAGVVKLKLATAEAVRAAWDEIATAVRSLKGKPQVTGCVVQEMIGTGAEVIVGARYDEQFGALVTCGIGGVAVEVIRDIAVALAPVDVDEASEMIRSLKGYRLLTGFRGAEPADIDAFAEIVSNVSRFAADHGHSVAEIDVNPVILRSKGGVAVDALVVTPRGDANSTR